MSQDQLRRKTQCYHDILLVPCDTLSSKCQRFRNWAKTFSDWQPCSFEIIQQGWIDFVPTDSTNKRQFNISTEVKKENWISCNSRDILILNYGACGFLLKVDFWYFQWQLDKGRCQWVTVLHCESIVHINLMLKDLSRISSFSAS